jgi:hypothetical protein
MRAFIIGLSLFAGQLNTLLPEPVVYLPPHKNSIDAAFDGSLLELINVPSVIYLPGLPPKADAQGNPWTIDIKNLGPAAVTVSASKTDFQAEIGVGQTIHIVSNGTNYHLKR